VRDNEVFIYHRTNTTTKTISLSFEAIEELYKAIKENKNK
jgi:predicted lipoprotein